MEAFLLGESIKSVGVAAMLLALTRTLKDEETAKRALTEAGHKFVVTEVGGKTSYDDFHEKVNRAVIGASLNSGIIEKTANDIHALIHATEEAKKGILVSVSSSASLALTASNISVSMSCGGVQVCYNRCEYYFNKCF